MEPISTFFTTALGYILKSAAGSKTAKMAKEEVLSKFWQWIRPSFIKEIPEIETKAQQPEMETKVAEKLLELSKDQTFFSELSKRVTELQQAGIKEKNIFTGSIKGMKQIRIGDTVYSPDEPFDRKNIVNGDIENGESFTLGDGH
ncbi:MAG: hypothetical protein OEM02_03885 [Desulfobulbaceae bacterium]|nr:hypothetical protein [Desulfobulbaceae bacterium]